MLRLRKGDPGKALPECLHEVFQVFLGLSGFDESLVQLRIQEVERVLRRSEDPGRPRYFALDRKTCRHLLFAPRPDKSYRITVVGSQVIEF